ncbi:MAG: hypothetical protein HZY75_02905 [Nocardioidaceae bacterium]|nr:MAG: hypothetical protein HZY75_02905 [Nocardioidaceae bacterium]
MLKFLLVVAFVALAIYLVVRRLQGPGNSGGTRPIQGPTRPIAPDDDEQFLRDLDWRHKHDEGN